MHRIFRSLDRLFTFVAASGRTDMSIRNALRLCLGALALALVPWSPRAADTEPGIWWEHTVQGEMGGMTLPPTTSKTCVPKSGMQEPPNASDEHCKVTDVKTSGNKMTWKMVCTGAEPMTGDGEIVQGKDRFTGKMTARMKRGEMTMKMSGKLLGGNCDASVRKKQVAAIQKLQVEQQQQSDQTYAAICDQGVDEMLFRLFSPPLKLCKDPAAAARACTRLGTRDGYLVYAKGVRTDPELPGFAKGVCKKDPDSYREKLCAKAAKEGKGDRMSDETLQFLGTSCPDEAQAVAQKECAGRSFTGMPDGFRRFCVEYARKDLETDRKSSSASEDEEEEEAPKERPKDSAVKKGKGVLRGLFK